MMSLALSEQARIYAMKKHGGMTRPNKARQPVTEHLQEVADMTAACGLPDHCVAAAWLHDCVEDTDTALEEIIPLFGPDVGRLVEGLTDPPEFAALELSVRKTRQAQRLKGKNDQIKLIKLCDQISNVHSVLIDAPVEWTDEKSFLYIEGAFGLAKVCRGLDASLDSRFEALYNKARKRYYRG